MPYTLDVGKVYYYGERKLAAITDLRSLDGKKQKYKHILKKVTKANSNFIDPDFPHDASSVGNLDSLLDVADTTIKARVEGWRTQGWDGTITWVRVQDLCQKQYYGANTACFNCGDLGKTIARNDIQQGCTGDCWFLSPVADITMIPRLINLVVPEGQNTNSEGIYHFRFWYEGVWVDICVDDYLPTLNIGGWYVTVGTNFYVNNTQAEFWPMMLEKAYAKLNGSYSNISANYAMYALENLTGGFGQCCNFSNGVPKNMYQTILKWIDKNCMVAAGTENSANGIIGDHAYSVTRAKVLTLNDGSTVNLLRLRNPWGDSGWLGDWCDGSSTWDQVSQEQKDALKIVATDTGEFWMAYDDFLKYYTDCSSCYYLAPSEFNQPGSKFQFAQFYTEWSTANDTVGGFNNPWDNPLYEVELSNDGSGKCILIVGLLVIKKLNQSLGNNEENCIRVFPVGTATDFDKGYFEKNYSNEILPDGDTEVPVNYYLNSYNLVYDLPAGKYIVLPSTLNKGVQMKLCFRVLNEGKAPAQAAIQPSARSRSNSASSTDSNSSSN